MSWSDPPPDPTNPDLLDNLRQFLISQGIVRDPRDGTQQGILPPLWLAPRLGVPAPGQTEGLQAVETDPKLVAAAIPATDIPPARYEGWLRYNHVQFVFRARTPPPALSLENSIRAAINDKRGWTMGSVSVIESLLFRGLQPLGSDPVAFNYECEYTFTIEGPWQNIS